MKKTALLSFAFFVSLLAMAQPTDSPLRIGVSGVAQGHPWNLIGAMNRGDFVMVGVAEENDDSRALENNVLVVRTLEAAIRSAKTGKAVKQ